MNKLEFTDSRMASSPGQVQAAHQLPRDIKLKQERPMTFRIKILYLSVALLMTVIIGVGVVFEYLVPWLLQMPLG